MSPTPVPADGRARPWRCGLAWSFPVLTGFAVGGFANGWLAAIGLAAAAIWIVVMIVVGCIATQGPRDAIEQELSDDTASRPPSP